MRKSEATPKTGAPADMPFFPGFAPPADIESMIGRYTSWLEDMGRVQQETLQFMRARLERDAEAASRIADCKTPAELVEWQIGYTKDYVEDYLREGQKIASMIVQSANGQATEAGGR